MQNALLAIVIILYIVPLCKLIWFVVRETFGLKKTQALVCEKKGIRFLHVVATIEYFIQLLRFYLVGIPVMLGCLVMGFMIILGIHQVTTTFCLYMAFVLLIVWHENKRTATDLRITKFIQEYPKVSPGNFFRKYAWELAFGGVDLRRCEQCTKIVPQEANFRKGERPKQKFSILIRALIDTAYICHICLAGLKALGPAYLNEFVDNMGALWGRRLLELSQSLFRVTGLEQLQGMKGRSLLVFNHKSSFDFVLTYFALSSVWINNERLMKPRFILAKDHFKDNWFVYHLLGIGKVCEAIDMVFVSRKEKDTNHSCVKIAAQHIVEKDIDITIYPQGTRAPGNYDRALKRRDAGFYTTVRKKDVESSLAHIKKGTSYLILDALTMMKAKGITEPLNLVFIGVNGTATILPKGSIRIQTETEVVFRVGEVVTLTTDILEEVFPQGSLPEEDPLNCKKFVADMSFLISKKLVSVLDLEEQLTQRYLTELKGQFRFDHDKIEFIARTIKEYNEEHDLVFQILDRIYSLPIPCWNGYLSQLSQLIQERTTQDRLMTLLIEITEELVRTK
ncbi:MAG: 1-acyl-sn-glycerol-3-phosphate acyltransferase [bacterium]|nr:1-acyl-sn-glycerol-3-phosphate acyltransferase [bacterium]MBU1918777.1 1-acyl-sn-glycerol-3-phosphate acyltransferase [bacterium]